MARVTYDDRHLDADYDARQALIDNLPDVEYAPDLPDQDDAVDAMYAAGAQDPDELEGAHS